MPEPLRCRAKVAAMCLDGAAQIRVYGPGEHMEDDGTWDGHSVVCHWCYAAIMPHTPSGKALKDEIEMGIAFARGRAGDANAN